MVALRNDKVSIDAFMSWIVHQEGRFELADGQIIMMVGAKIRHNIVVNNVTVALTPLARQCGCQSTTSDTAVQTGLFSLRYPDVVVDCGNTDPDAMIAGDPRIIVEVSSPSTAQVDAVIKLDEYRRLANVQMVIQIEPDVVLVSVHRRINATSWHTEIFEALDAVIDLPSLSGKLSLKDIYETVPAKPRLQLKRGE